MIKIAIFVNNIAISDGVSRWAQQLCLRYPKEKYDVHLYVVGDVDASVSFDFQNVKIFPIKKDIRFLIPLMRDIKSSKYDVAHVNNHYFSAVLLVLLCFCGVSKRIVHSRGETLIEDKKSRFPYRNLIPILRLFILILSTEKWAVSQKAGGGFFFFLFYKSKKVKVVRSGIDLGDFFDSNRVRSYINSNLVMANVGRFHNQKNQVYLLKVFSEIVKVKVGSKLFLIGNGPDLKKLRLLCSSLNISESVSFHDDIQNVPEFLLMNNVNVAAFPSLYEGLPRAAVETQACGIYTFLSENISHEAAVIDGRSQFLSIENDPKSWANAILKNFKKWRYVSVTESYAKFRNSDIFIENALDSFFHEIDCLVK